MALKKSKKIKPNETNSDDQEKRQTERKYEGLEKQLESADITERRWAARDLANFEESAKLLINKLQTEPEHSVKEAIFDSLQSMGGDDVVNGLLPMLRLEDAELRNGAIEVLQSMPEGVAIHIIELLNDGDSDVRIFAIDILQELAHPQTPQWLLSVLKDETHINVVATAVDRLTEVGTPDMIPELLQLKQRFPNENFLGFAVDTAISRIEEG